MVLVAGAALRGASGALSRRRTGKRLFRFRRRAPAPPPRREARGGGGKRQVERRGELRPLRRGQQLGFERRRLARQHSDLEPPEELLQRHLPLDPGEAYGRSRAVRRGWRGRGDDRFRRDDRQAPERHRQAPDQGRRTGAEVDRVETGPGPDEHRREGGAVGGGVEADRRGEEGGGGGGG